MLPARQVVPLPDGASFDLGAALGIPALTAHLALTADGPARALGPGALDGRSVLVAGGAGAVGHAAIELAVWAGAHVLTTVSSPEKAALAAAAGAHEVIDYRREDVAARIRALVPGGVDLVVEVNPHANAELDAAVLAPNGTVVVYATDRAGADAARRAAVDEQEPRLAFLLTYTAPAPRRTPRSRASRPRWRRARCGSARTPGCRCPLPPRAHRRRPPRRRGGHDRQDPDRRRRLTLP